MKNMKTKFKKQIGAVLAVSLIMLLVLTLMGLSGVQMTSLEEKMVGNMGDQGVAFQAAESALRDGEADLCKRKFDRTEMNSSCTNGLCFVETGGNAKVWEHDSKVANAVSYGAKTTHPTITGLFAQPRYLIVGTTNAKMKMPGTDASAGGKHAYQITAIAQGGQSTTKTILREIYVP